MQGSVDHCPCCVLPQVMTQGTMPPYINAGHILGAMAGEMGCSHDYFGRRSLFVDRLSEWLQPEGT